MNNLLSDSLINENWLSLIEIELVRLLSNNNSSEHIYVEFADDMEIDEIKIRLFNCYYAEVYCPIKLLDRLSNIESASLNWHLDNNIWNLISDCK